MAYSLAEGFVDQLKTYMEANIATKVAALNTEYNDGITLATTVTTYVGIKSLRSVQDFPSLFILSPRESFRAMTVSGSSSVGTIRPEVAVGVIVLDQDSETLQRRLYRYGRALLELILDGAGAAGALGGWTIQTAEEWDIDTIAAEYSESDQSMYIGEATLTITANKIESK